MTRLVSVNDVVTNPEVFNEKYIYVTGIFHYGFEKRSLSHWPKSEGLGFLSFHPGMICLEFNRRAAPFWDGKRVIMGGIISLPCFDDDVYFISLFGGNSRYGMGSKSASAEILATYLCRLKDWNRNHSDDIEVI